MAFVSVDTGVAFISATANASTKKKQERYDDVLSGVVEQLHDLVSCGMGMFDSRKETDADADKDGLTPPLPPSLPPRAFTETEMYQLVLSWMDEAHMETIDILQRTQTDLMVPHKYSREQEKKMKALLEEAYFAFREYENSLLALAHSSNEITSQDFHLELTTVVSVFKKLRSVYQRALRLNHDFSIGYRRYTSVEQQLVIYAPYWVPILVPLFRWNR